MLKRSYPWYAFCALVIVLTLAIASSCSFGLQPLSSRNETVVALQLSALTQPDGARNGRAIVQGSGFLYIRTFGGPAGTSGPFYGPYAMSSDTQFSTDDLPAGNFSDIALLFSANRINETKSIDWKGKPYTFSQIMRLSDAELTSVITNGGQLFDGFFDGEASTGMTGKVTIRENKTTKLSVVLIPATDAGYYLDFTSVATRTLPAQGSTVRKFYEIGGVGATLSASEFEVSCAISPGKAALSLGIVALYASDGTLIQNFGAIGSLSETKTLTATVKKADYYFLYIEYQSVETITLGFSASIKAPTTPVVPPVGGSALTVNVTGNAMIQSKTFYYSVYDMTGYIEDPELMLYLYGPIGTLCGYGAIALDASGNGSGTALAPGGTPLSVSSTSIYLVYGFVDMNSPSPRYAGTYLPGAALTANQVKNIVPRTGDWWTEDPVSCTPIVSSTVTVTMTNLVANADTVYFVSQSGGGDNLGLTYENPMPLSSIIASFDSANVEETIYLTGPVTVTSTIYFRYNRELAGAPGLASAPTVSAPSLMGNLLKSSGSGGDSLLMHDLTITGPGTTPPLGYSLIDIGNTQLILGDKFLIQDFAFYDGIAGGAVRANPGCSVIMLGNASITNMTTEELLNGGAMYLDGSTLLMFNSSSIRDCVGWQNGGALYLTGTGAIATLNQSSLITGCSATIAGGAVFVSGATAGLMLYDASSITWCSASNGGAIYSDSGIVNLNGDASGAGVRITNCTASQNGGGIFLYQVSESNFTISGLVTVTLNTAGSKGGGVMCMPTLYTAWNAYVPAYISGNTVSGVENNIQVSGI